MPTTAELRDDYKKAADQLRKRRQRHGEMFSPKLEKLFTDGTAMLEIIKTVKAEAIRIIEAGLYAENHYKEAMYSIVKRWFYWETGSYPQDRDSCSKWHHWCDTRNIPPATEYVRYLKGKSRWNVQSQ